MSLLADTSFFIALTDKDDAHHAVAQAWKQHLRVHPRQLVLHAGILMELGDGFARLSRRETGRRLVETLLGATEVTCLQITDNLLVEGSKLYIGSKDKEWGLTDCVSFVLMKKLRITKSLTADPHFRQAGFEALLLKPPRL